MTVRLHGGFELGASGPFDPLDLLFDEWHRLALIERPQALDDFRF
jgi:hypothetical protein